ncbi:two-component system osmolarity sensor histidine kinase EnvZ [Chitinivorax tropicus]|uniref:histidine kinase n=1 Tax=Chitinivorax tropicus TaxID=714531 RepID=A0A840MR14_9PROT|nr:ATP-binding protein [Chitinivorax tropicus]MBB5017671.1 two-component system osmolarity sensor histidine kinase EnvZ [Chitinivorax tropicus]
MPRSLFGRLAAMLVGLVMVSQLFTLGLLHYNWRHQMAQQISEEVIDALADLESTLANMNADERALYLDAYNRPFSINLLPRTAARPPINHQPLDGDLDALLIHLKADGLAFNDVRFQLLPKPLLWLQINMLNEPHWLVIPIGSPQPQLRTTLSLAVLGFSAIAVVAAFFFAWYLNRPLKQLISAARQLTQGEHPAPLPEGKMRETRSLAKTFNSMTQALQQAETDRRVMLAGISHDVRTPLTRLRLGVEMMQDNSLREGMLTDIDDIDRIVRQFRDFIAGEPEEQAQVCDLNELLRDTQDRYQRQGLMLQIQPAVDIPLVKVHPLAIQRLLTNLIDNARLYGAPPIEITIKQIDARLILQVRDHGQGIPSHMILTLMQPFTRLDPARRADGGSGLGLAIVRRIADAHRAELQVSNHPAGGLLVSIAFPIATQAQNA